MTDPARVDRSTAWVAVASTIAGVLDAVSTIVCIQIGVTTGELGAATLAVALFPIIDRLGGVGLIAATVREPDPDRDAMSSVLWLGLGVAAVLTGLLFVGRSLIARAFPDPIVATLLVAYSARLLVRHWAVAPEAMLKRALRYRELSIVRVCGELTEAFVKLGLAYAGVHGNRDLAIWCFVIGPIANAIVTTAGTLVCYPWLPRFTLKRDVVRRVARFCAAVSGGDLLYFAYTSADYLVIGRYFGRSAVGIYRLAYELVIDVVRMLSLVTTEVAFPTFARLAEDLPAVGAHLLRFTRQNLMVLAPFLVFVGIEADDLLAGMFGTLPPQAATAARILCVVGATRTLGFVLPAMLAGLGLASRVLLYNTIAAIFLPLAFVIAAEVAPASGYVAVAAAWAIGYPIVFAVLLSMSLPHAELTLGAYVRAIRGIVAIAACAAGAGLLARMALPDVATARLLVVATVVLAVYAALLARFERVTLGSVVRALRA